MGLRKAIAAALERGAFGGAFAGAASAGWGAIAGARLARPLAWPETKRVVAVSGSTLGGSGGTPLALALTRALADAGARAALVGHGYGGCVRVARAVSPDDDVRRVGDEALQSARELAGIAAVFVGPSRKDAVAIALEGADVAVVDGLLQARPRRVDCALLVLDAERPWGAGDCPPRGDLRAPRSALLGCADAVVVVRDPLVPLVGPLTELSLPRFEARVSGLGARVGGCLVPWEALAKRRVGLLLGVARPDRVLRFLARRAIRPDVVLAGADHSPPRPTSAGAKRAARALHLDLWLTTAKCAAHIATQDAENLGILDYRATVPPALLAFVRGAPPRIA